MCCDILSCNNVAPNNVVVCLNVVRSNNVCVIFVCDNVVR